MSSQQTSKHARCKRKRSEISADVVSPPKPKKAHVKSPADRGLCSTCSKFDWKQLIHDLFDPKVREERSLRMKRDESRRMYDPKYGGEYTITQLDVKLEVSPVSSMIVTQAECSICSLAVRALALNVGSTSQISCAVRESNENVSVFLRAFRLAWTSWTSASIDFEFPTSDKPHYVSLSPFLNNSRSARHYLRAKDTLYRQASPARRRDCVDLEVIRDWWRDCQSTHPDCFRGVSQDFWLGYTQAAGRQPSFRVVDVLEDRVMVPPMGSRYVVLSYVWGKVKVYRARLSDFVDVQDGEGKMNSHRRYLPLSRRQLPQTIRDAMFLVQAIGERYLWVDTLCITQDDPEEVASLIKVMDRIYENALLTIVAATGTNADSGLHGLHPGSRDLQYVTGTVEGISLTTDGRILDEDRDWGVTPWYTRGWTYQEDHFSRRCLTFCNGRAFYDCPSGTWGETRPRMPLKTTVRPGRHHWGPEPWSTAPFRMYARHVAHYTRRSLSFAEDILNAFAGIMRQGEVEAGMEFCWGLPMTHFREALMWHHVLVTRYGPPKRRQELQGVGPRLRFPSWSWSGWTGPIAYSASLWHYPPLGRENRDANDLGGFREALCWPWDQEYNIQDAGDIFETGILTFWADTTFITQEDISRYLRSTPVQLDDGTMWERGRECIVLGPRRNDLNAPDKVAIVFLVVQEVDGVYYRQGVLDISEDTWTLSEYKLTRKIVRLG